MKYSAISKPGMGDPYWYEWSVGEQYIIDMLNPDNQIIYVELQANVALGLDDIVVSYADGNKLFVQVKHTRTDDTLTFGDLVSVDNTKKDNKNRSSLLAELAKSWNEEKGKYQKSRICLFTNRKVGMYDASAGVSRSITRPALKAFWSDLKEQLANKSTFQELEFPGYEEAWEEWKRQIDCIEDDLDKVAFLNCLEIETNQIGLEEIGCDLSRRLQEILHVDTTVAEMLLGRIDHALREWTTSIRSASRVSVEDVYQVLSVQEELISYNHDLIPSSPFFLSREKLVESLESELSSGASRVIYLSGIPGTGKTNIISKISGIKNSIVDVRYYAYEPIDPAKEYLPLDVSKRVDKNAFWNELFNQLRRILQGQLYKYKVPVINSLMTIEEMRSQFFRIASEYASERGRDFIIAIDGIDHAARAGIDAETFLGTIPAPEYIPSNIKILLAGQPKEDYKNYPAWLYDSSALVKELQVPSLQSCDVSALVDARFDTSDMIYRQQLVELICRYAEGNTLAAIFAVHEALLCNNIVDLEERLKGRQLSGNIQEYYKNIWDAAKANFEIPFMDYKMAGVFAFFNEPINEHKLREIFTEEQISAYSWRNVLKALKPLLIESNGNYTILHNDVRLYLSKVIGRDSDHVKEIYSNLADYYINKQQKDYPYYNDVLRFLKAAGREEEFEKVYSVDYIISAYVSGIELTELRLMSKEILQSIVNKDPINWMHMQCLSLGLMTIDQIEKSKYEIEDSNFRKEIQLIRIQPCECYVTASNCWNYDVLSQVLSLTNRLYENGESDRGKRLFDNWFKDTTIGQIYNCLESEEYDDFLSPNLQNIAEYLSKCVCYTNRFSIVSGIVELVENHSKFVFAVIEKIISNAFLMLEREALYNALSSLEIVYIEPIVEGIKKLLTDNRFEELMQIEVVLHNRLQINAMGILVSAFLQIITRSEKWGDCEKIDLWESISKVIMPDAYIENLMSYYSMYALVASYLQTASRSSVVSTVTEKYISKHTNYNKNYVALYFNSVCFIGKWLKCRHSGDLLNENISDIQVILENLFIKQWKPNDRDFESVHLRAYVLKAMILLSNGEPESVKTIVFKGCEKIFEKNPVNQLLDPGILFYQNQPNRIQAWFDEWLGENGRVWGEPIRERNNIIKAFISVKQKYDRNNRIDMQKSIERARWSVIGYASHKEYSADYLLKWYNSFVESDETYIVPYAGRVKEVSDFMKILGDNRTNYVLNSKIYTDLFSRGYNEIKKVLSNSYYLNEVLHQPSYLVDGIIGYLKTAVLDKEMLLVLWGIGIGLLDWRNEDEHATICSLQRALEIYAIRNGILDITNDLRTYGAGYVDLSTDPVRYIIPDRWCDNQQKNHYFEDARVKIEDYINDVEKTEKESDVLKCIRQIFDSGDLSNELIEKLIIHEFEKEKYGIMHNTLLEYLIGISETKIADKAVRNYINTTLSGNDRYLESDVPELVRWKIKCCGRDYCKIGLDSLIAMQNSWITAAGHIHPPMHEIVHDYTQYIEWNQVRDFKTLFLQILFLIIRSVDADAARIALGGLLAILRIDKDCINFVENDWKKFHYRAKEWIMMIYELLWNYNPQSQSILTGVFAKHASDDDFNVALYSNLLLEKLSKDSVYEYIKCDKVYFKEIPQSSYKRLIKTPRKNPWINGYECVLEQKELLEKRLDIDLTDVETRTAKYSQSITPFTNLIPLHRTSSNYKVVCDDVNRAFFRVLYKDWIASRWDGAECDLARVLLSASEPYCLLVTPPRWNYNDGKLIDNPKKYIKATNGEQLRIIKDTLNTGVNSEYLVLAGVVIDYTYKQEIFGFCLSYFDVPGMKAEYAIPSVERNVRLFLQARDDFVEGYHINVTLHQNGIESFKHSNIMCGFSKFVLEAFGWKIDIDCEGVWIKNHYQNVIGKLECFYGIKTNIENRYHSNQPYLQRWIVKKAAIEQAKYISGCPYEIRMVYDKVINEFD